MQPTAELPLVESRPGFQVVSHSIPYRTPNWRERNLRHLFHFIIIDKHGETISKFLLCIRNSKAKVIPIGMYQREICWKYCNAFSAISCANISLWVLSRREEKTNIRVSELQCFVVFSGRDLTSTYFPLAKFDYFQLSLVAKCDIAEGGYWKTIQKQTKPRLLTFTSSSLFFYFFHPVYYLRPIFLSPL